MTTGLPSTGFLDTDILGSIEALDKRYRHPNDKGSITYRYYESLCEKASRAIFKIQKYTNITKLPKRLAFKIFNSTVLPILTWAIPIKYFLSIALHSKGWVGRSDKKKTQSNTIPLN